MNSVLEIPGYATGFAHNAAESDNPGLWDGLVGAWAPTLGVTGDVLRDQSAFGNHGTLATMDPATDWVATEKGWALDFNGVNGVVIYGSTEMPTSGTLTSALWLYLPTTVDRNQIYYSYAAAGRTHCVGVNGGALLTSFNPNEGLVDASTHLNANAWNHLVCIWSGDQVIDEIWVNGRSRTIGGVGASYGIDGFVLGGRDPINFDFPFLGQIASFSLYSRGLIGSEIQQLYVDPHALFRVRRRVFASAVGAPPSFQSSWASGVNQHIGLGI